MMLFVALALASIVSAKTSIAVDARGRLTDLDAVASRHLEAGGSQRHSQKANEAGGEGYDSCLVQYGPKHPIDYAACLLLDPSALQHVLASDAFRDALQDELENECSTMLIDLMNPDSLCTLQNGKRMTLYHPAFDAYIKTRIDIADQEQCKSDNKQPAVLS